MRCSVRGYNLASLRNSIQQRQYLVQGVEVWLSHGHSFGIIIHMEILVDLVGAIPANHVSNRRHTEQGISTCMSLVNAEHVLNENEYLHFLCSGLPILVWFHFLPLCSILVCLITHSPPQFFRQQKRRKKKSYSEALTGRSRETPTFTAFFVASKKHIRLNTVGSVTQ